MQREIGHGFPTGQGAWPVGSVFIAVVDTNPADLLGYGNWVAFGTGRTLVGFDATQTEFDTVEETGGAKTHTLTSGEMPAHTHQELVFNGAGGGTTNAKYCATTGATNTPHVVSVSTTAGDGSPIDLPTGSTGSGAAHNNMQPYIVVYFWKRTA